MQPCNKKAVTEFIGSNSTAAFKLTKLRNFPFSSVVFIQVSAHVTTGQDINLLACTSACSCILLHVTGPGLRPKARKVKIILCIGNAVYCGKTLNLYLS